MADEEIEIEISAQGKVTIHTKGFKGPQCLKIAEMFARVLGPEQSRQLTSEYYEQPVEVQTQVHVSNRYLGDS